jgi:hypothetical protein
MRKTGTHEKNHFAVLPIQVAGFRKQPGLRSSAMLQEKIVALACDRTAIAGGKLVGPGEVVQTRGIGGSDRRIFVEAPWSGPALHATPELKAPTVESDRPLGQNLGGQVIR